jgi:predicted nucleic acid-binding protein
MDRVFLDANVLFSAAYKPETRLLRLWKVKNVVLCSSRYALEEARLNLETEEQKDRLLKLSQALQVFDEVTGSPGLRTVLPEKDQPILLAAIEARATHLLTGDIRHFGRFFGRKVKGVKILLPGDYLRSIQSHEAK